MFLVLYTASTSFQSVFSARTVRLFPRWRAAGHPDHRTPSPKPEQTHPECGNNVYVLLRRDTANAPYVEIWGFMGEGSQELRNPRGGALLELSLAFPAVSGGVSGVARRVSFDDWCFLAARVLQAATHVDLAKKKDATQKREVVQSSRNIIS